MNILPKSFFEQNEFSGLMWTVAFPSNAYELEDVSLDCAIAAEGRSICPSCRHLAESSGYTIGKAK